MEPSRMFLDVGFDWQDWRKAKLSGVWASRPSAWGSTADTFRQS
jgi:hypothetical protein